MRKFVHAMCEQQRRRSACPPAGLIRAFVVHCLDSIIPLVSISEISSLYIASMTGQASLSLRWSKTPKTGFLMTMLICIDVLLMKSLSISSSCICFDRCRASGVIRFDVVWKLLSTDQNRHWIVCLIIRQQYSRSIFRCRKKNKFTAAAWIISMYKTPKTWNTLYDLEKEVVQISLGRAGRMSRLMTKPTKWLWAQQRFRSA